MSDPNTPTLGKKIDELLAPFLQDESELQNRLAELKSELEQLQTEMEQVSEDLAVVQSAKIDAFRQAAQDDPVLSAVFMADQAGPKLVDDDSENDGHPLLSHAS
ncbi:hypothetical protein [Algisphaera agarilytica]|uniref:Uncharacterized protein n=1 Tax=Algisphaera agarilytica TaxID=1385975 RepID=A0A7X0H799_9BACT|nr:hypothetical protein [Algisphaera agarilytica]MBB6430586.1 hypothetical protein [Algisphaera agarilytica]